MSTTVSGAVSVIVTVHGNEAQVTSTVTVEPLEVAPPPTDAGEIASAAWKGWASTEPLLVQTAQPCPAPLTPLVTLASSPSLSAWRRPPANDLPPSAL